MLRGFCFVLCRFFWIFLCRQPCHSQRGTIFSPYLYAFLFLGFLMALTRASSIMFNKSGKSRHLRLVLNLRTWSTFPFRSISFCCTHCAVLPLCAHPFSISCFLCGVILDLFGSAVCAINPSTSSSVVASLIFSSFLHPPSFFPASLSFPLDFLSSYNFFEGFLCIFTLPCHFLSFSLLLTTSVPLKLRILVGSTEAVLWSVPGDQGWRGRQQMAPPAPRAVFSPFLDFG